MTDHKENAEEIGRAIYKSKILPTLQPEDKGKIVLIDVRSGDYEISEDDISGLVRLLERRPDCYAWTKRVGYPAVYRINPGSPQTEESKKAEKIGRAIYKSKILPLMQPEDKGKIVYIDIHSGDYEIDIDEAAAMVRLLERRPHAYAWTGRVGYLDAPVHSFGWAGTFLPFTDSEDAE